MRNTPEIRALVNTRATLTPIIRDTKLAIGDVAEVVYQQLQEHSKPSTTRKDLLSRSTAFGIPYYWVRRSVDLPQDSRLLPETQLRIHDIQSVGEDQEIHLFAKSIGFPVSRSVTVDFSGQTPEASTQRRVSTQNNGLVEYTRDSESNIFPSPTQPKITEKHSLGVHFGHEIGYKDPDELRRDYATAFQGAVGATIFVASTLYHVLGIPTKTTELPNLIKKWQKVAPVEMPPEIAVLLPHKPLI